LNKILFNVNCRLFTIDIGDIMGIIENTGLTMNVCGYLRGKIISAELAPGQKLNEEHLSLSLGISRGPIREALRILENEHLVVTHPRKGSFVAELSIEDLNEVYEAREAIECSAIDILMTKKIRDFSSVASAVHNVSDLPFQRRDDANLLLVFREKITDFHVKLVELAGNSRLTRFYQALYFNLARYEYMYFSLPGTLEHSLEDHRKVLESLEAGDYENAKEFLKRHFNYSFNFQKSILEEKLKKTNPSIPSISKWEVG